MSLRTCLDPEALMQSSIHFHLRPLERAIPPQMSSMALVEGWRP